MTHFRDLTLYSYGAAASSGVSVRNIGWLTAGIEFPITTSVDPSFVDRLWRFCKVSIRQTRGIHECELCCSHEANIARRSGEELLLGSAEIRVISDQGQVYAAPNLTYHYVVAHNYAPPQEFADAVLKGPCPPEAGYYELLSKLGLVWGNTPNPAESGKRFRFVKTSDGVVRVEE